MSPVARSSREGYTYTTGMFVWRSSLLSCKPKVAPYQCQKRRSNLDLDLQSIVEIRNSNVLTQIWNTLNRYFPLHRIRPYPTVMMNLISVRYNFIFLSLEFCIHKDEYLNTLDQFLRGLCRCLKCLRWIHWRFKSLPECVSMNCRSSQTFQAKFMIRILLQVLVDNRSTQGPSGITQMVGFCQSGAFSFSDWKKHSKIFIRSWLT